LQDQGLDAMVQGGEIKIIHHTGDLSLAEIGPRPLPHRIVEVQGAQQVKTSIPDAVKVFIYPPSYPVLKERLKQRRQDPEKAIGRRLQWAMRELGVAGEFDYAIINDRLDEAVDALFGICLAEHHRSKRMKPRLDIIREAFQEALEKDFAR
jgi:guanylate kinase